MLCAVPRSPSPLDPLRSPLRPAQPRLIRLSLRPSVRSPTHLPPSASCPPAAPPSRTSPSPQSQRTAACPPPQPHAHPPPRLGRRGRMGWRGLGRGLGRGPKGARRSRRPSVAGRSYSSRCGRRRTGSQARGAPSRAEPRRAAARTAMGDRGALCFAALCFAALGFCAHSQSFFSPLCGTNCTRLRRRLPRGCRAQGPLPPRTAPSARTRRGRPRHGHGPDPHLPPCHPHRISHLLHKCINCTPPSLHCGSVLLRGARPLSRWLTHTLFIAHFHSVSVCPALRTGAAEVLVASDVAARGLDIPSVQLVVHADLPNDGDTCARVPTWPEISSAGYMRFSLSPPPSC